MLLRSVSTACGVAVSLAAAVLVGCSARPEQPILEEFFSASRMADRTTLATLSTTAFEPASAGIVTSFTITGVTPEQRKPRQGGGDVLTKDVTIDAPVKLPTGQAVQKTLVVTMQRTEAGGDTPVGRWIVTDIKDASRSPAPLRP
jgi:hypothetical protein